MSATLQGNRNLFPNYWAGQGRLWEVFWLWGVALSAVFAAVFAIGLYQDILWLKLVMLAVFAVYTPWIVVSVWRCAPNAKDERLGIIARALTVAWALNVVFLLIALLFDIFISPVFGVA